ncbi:glycosyltransferase [Micromonospora sediminimaris]|uniref:glycosyltransferase n=1 Tax=Micromonospora sediminimaris TaxID=547162 RepID=UPI0035A25C90
MPAYNEESYLPKTLSSIQISAQRTGVRFELIVVDNASSDHTRIVAQVAGATVVRHGQRGAGAARNAGARAAVGDYLVFIDADVTVSEYAFSILVGELDRRPIRVGAFRAIYMPKKLGSWLLCAYWDWKRSRGGPCQGVSQIFRRDLFDEARGYDPELVMGEDADLYRRASSKDLEDGGVGGVLIQDAIVWPSCRRYDAWPSWRMFTIQNSLAVRFFPRSEWVWRAWRQGSIR